ncbi:hypothetical protein GCM10023189_17980 [Nibrella saemangeumensis]|uniref:Gliding motility-associated C-terminal domain-containing protein n=1 Tax=Nibrella saemangeumensis TaxID=1084526 RepID=A0ABP8MQK4_9BACT
MNIFTRPNWVCLLLVLAYLIPVKQAFGHHIVGGDISMVNLGQPGYFRLSLNQFWDEEGIALSGNNGNYEANLTVFVYSLRTRQLMDQFQLNRTSKQDFSYENPTCARSQGLRTSEVRYSADVRFNPDRYTDPSGYYIVWERCCRNAAVSNIATPGQVGMVFYMEFPAMRPNSRTIINSSPDFVLPNGKYACVNKPFQLLFKANDADGDELRYRLVTPLVGYTSSTQSLVITPQSRTSYPTATWRTGYSDRVMIPGPVPLQINERTGELTLTAGQEGLFVFAVEAVELRDGVPIGLVRREFQLMVKDCNPITAPAPVVTSNSLPATDVSFCSGGSVRLETQADPKWLLQWQKDKVNITGATGPTLTVREPGVYTVVKSLSDVCAKDTVSQQVNATLTPAARVKLTPSGSLSLCEGESVRLQTSPAQGTLRWFHNKTDLNQPNVPAITAQLSGTYLVEYTETGNACPGRDSVRLLVNPAPTASLAASPRPVVCGSTPVQLTATSSSGVQYAWLRDGAPWQETTQPAIATSRKGRYQVAVTDRNGCRGTSASLDITEAPLPLIRFDSIAPICDTRNAVTLAATPTGGQYAGTGTAGNQFDPAAAGPGQHTVTYTYTDANGCKNQQTRIVLVQEDVGLNMPEELVVLRGESGVMPVTVKIPVVQATWSPPDDLDNPDVLQPTTRPEDSKTYTIAVVTASGCQAEGKIHVKVVERMFLPTAFSPNNDGANDTWELRGVHNFPDCDVYIFNRWGSVIFYSKGYQQPWDGTYRGERVEPGTYTFRIDTNLKSIQYRGHITVLY